MGPLGLGVMRCQPGADSSKAGDRARLPGGDGHTPAALPCSLLPLRDGGRLGSTVEPPLLQMQVLHYLRDPERPVPEGG